MKNDLNFYFEKIRNGDINAFSEMYEKIKVPIFTIIFRIVKDYHLSEEIMQEFFLKLFLSPPNPSVKNIRAYVFQMARNLSIDALRKKENTKSESLDDFEISSDGSFERFIFDIDLENAMLKLDDIEREIVSLHLNGGLTFFEISKILNLSLTSVYKKYRKGIDFLKDELKEERL